MELDDLIFLQELNPAQLATDLQWYLQGVDLDANVAAKNGAEVLSCDYTSLYPSFNLHIKRHINTDASADRDTEGSKDNGPVLLQDPMSKDLATDREFWSSLLQQSLDWCLEHSRSRQEVLVATLVEHEDEIREFSMDLNFCDSTLSLVEEALNRHYTSLSKASKNIENLHKESAGISTCLDNRQALLEKLQRFMSDVLVTPSLIKALCNDPIDVNYIQTLEQFVSKSEAINRQFQDVHYPCLDSSRVQLKKLHLVVVRRINDYLAHQLSKLSMSKSNISLIQETQLLRLKPLFLYLESRSNYGPQMRCQYGRTMKRTYAHLFGNYLLALDQYKRKNPYRDVNLILKSWHNPKDSCFILGSRRECSFASKSASSGVPTPTPGGVGEAVVDLLAAAASVEPIVIAGLQPNSLKTEDLVKSYCKLLLDTATTEYYFITRFFSNNPTTVTLEIFSDVIQVLSTRLRSTLKNSYDVLCMAFIHQVLSVNMQLLANRGLAVLNQQLTQIQHLIFRRARFVLLEFSKVTNTLLHVAHANTLDPGKPMECCSNAGHLIHGILTLASMNPTGDVVFVIDVGHDATPMGGGADEVVDEHTDVNSLPGAATGGSQVTVSWSKLIDAYVNQLYTTLLSAGKRFTDVIKQSSFYIANCMAVTLPLKSKDANMAFAADLGQFQRLLQQQTHYFCKSVINKHYPQLLNLLAQVQADVGGNGKTIEVANAASANKQKMIKAMATLGDSKAAVEKILAKFQDDTTRQQTRQQLASALIDIYTPIFNYMQQHFQDTEWFSTIPEPGQFQ